jgi:fluoride ion exporter CrcB/FEX
MNAAPWKIVLVLVLGSAAGALIRQALILVLPRSRGAMSGVMLAGSSILGGLIGAALGGIITTSAFTAEEQSLWLVGFIAALGTFGASAVLTISPSRQQETSLLRTAAVHIALAILAAAFGIGLILWVRSASG